MEDNSKQTQQENESNAARRLRLLGEDGATPEDEPIEVNKWANFWYHHKIKVIMVLFFAVTIGIGVSQLLSMKSPDVYIFYSGPSYITPNQNAALCDALERLMPDYNGDGRIYAQLNDLVFMTDEQAEEYIAAAEAAGEDATIDYVTNSDTYNRFIFEIFGENSSICILAEGQYEIVKSEGGFEKLSDIFTEIPVGAADEYGIKLSETNFAEFYTAFGIFPEDTVIALRKLSTLSSITGKKKAEEKYSYHRDLFMRIAQFEFPEGYTPEEKE